MRYPLGVCTISACRRDTSLPGTTTSHEASRPKTSEVPAMAYSRPSVNDTTRPPVLTVTLPPLASALAWAIACGTLMACTYCVLPLRRSSTNVSSCPPTATRSRWEGGRFGTQAHAVDQNVRLWNCLCDDHLPIWQGFQLRVLGENTWNGERDGAAG